MFCPTRLGRTSPATTFTETGWFSATEVPADGVVPATAPICGSLATPTALVAVATVSPALRNSARARATLSPWGTRGTVMIRGPWVFPAPGGDGWHMLITARASHDPAAGRGVIGHAWSGDLLNWEVRPPLTEPAGFGHLEVPQVAVVDGQPLLLFCTNPGSDPIWIVPGPSVAGPWDMTLARPVRCPGIYAPCLVCDASGAWQLIGFIAGPASGFVGGLSDPIPVRYTPSAGLECGRHPQPGEG